MLKEKSWHPIPHGVRGVRRGAWEYVRGLVGLRLVLRRGEGAEPVVRGCTGAGVSRDIGREVDDDGDKAGRGGWTGVRDARVLGEGMEGWSAVRGLHVGGVGEGKGEGGEGEGGEAEEGVWGDSWPGAGGCGGRCGKPQGSAVAVAGSVAGGCWRPARWLLV